MKFKSFKGILTGLILTVSSMANAGIIYSYTGNTFTEVNGLSNPTDSVTATLILEEQLEANLVNMDITTLAGFNLVMNSRNWDREIAKIDFQDANYIDDIYLRASVTTDAARKIVGWSMWHSFASIDGIDNWQIQTNGHTYPTGVFGYDEDEYTVGGTQEYQGAVGVSGTWVSVSVPEPSTLIIFALGMIGIASRRFKK